jgi:hypothetical protein
MTPGGTGSIYGANTVGNQGGGNKKQGLPPTIGRAGWLSNFIKTNSGSSNRGPPAGGGPVDPCPANEKTGDYLIGSQEAADLLGGVTKINGSLIINGIGSNITNLTPFGCLKEVTDFFRIVNFELAEIAGFGRLKTVGDYFAINSNANLTTISGFGSLTSVGGDFAIYTNAKLTNASSLWNVTSVGGEFSCYGNDEFTNTAFADLVAGLTTIGGNINVNHNSAANFAKPGALQKWGAAGSKDANTRTLNGEKATELQNPTNSFGGPGVPADGGFAQAAWDLFEVNDNTPP